MAQQLRGYLRARQASPQDCEDLLQECVIRVLRAQPAFSDARDLTRWCIPVVRNLSVDLYRRGRRETLWDAVPDAPGHGDLHEHVSHKLELGRVLRAMHQLRPTDREAIVSHVQQDSVVHLDRRQAVRLNVQRHRARQRLLAKLAGVIAAAWALGRRTTRVAVPATLPAALALSVLTPHLARLDDGQLPERATTAVVQAGVTSASGPHAASAATRGAGVSHSPSAAGTQGGTAKPRAVLAAVAPTGESVRASRRSTPDNSVDVCVRNVGPVERLCVGAEAQVRSPVRAP